MRILIQETCSSGFQQKRDARFDTPARVADEAFGRPSSVLNRNDERVVLNVYIFLFFFLFSFFFFLFFFVFRKH